MKKAEIASMIDHTLLKANATKDQINTLCDQAAEYKFASVCINPIWVSQAAKKLKNTRVAVCTVVGFPLGATPSAVKAFETKKAIEEGATEIDMVISVGHAKMGDEKYLIEDISAVVEAAQGKLVKVIIETCYLTDDEKRMACNAAVKAGADFVKTSTGFGNAGAKPEDVTLMKAQIPDSMKVKAAGGIHSLEEAEQMINAGASRIGASSGIEIVGEAE